MNKNLVRLLLCLLAPLLLLADNDLASFHLSANKTDVYEREAVEISFTATQIDHEDVMFFILQAQQSDDYEISLLNKESTKLGYHNTTTTFNYLLFPQKVGKIKVGFDFTIKTASDAAVAQIYVGSRDNVKLIETIDTVVVLEPLELKVKALKPGTVLVGDFKLASHLLSDTVDQFSTVQVSYTLNGVGYLDKKMEPLPPIKDATLFDDIVDHTFKSSKNGYVVEREYAYAISAEDDFTLPEIHLQAYSPRTERYYELIAPASKITIKKIDPKTLVDDKEFPVQETYDWSWVKNSLLALFIFTAGFMTAKLSEGIHFKWLQRSERFRDIKESQDAKTLMKILSIRYADQGLDEYIDVLEMIIYKKSDQKFKALKQAVLKSLYKNSN